MYSVSNDYLNKIKSASIKRRCIRGSLDAFSFTENDILAASFQYSDIAVKSSDVKLGGVFVGQMSLTFLDSFVSHVNRGTWRGREINTEIGLRLDNQQWEYVPLKPYFIDSADHSALGVDVVAYDAMAKFDKPINLVTSTGRLWAFANMACIDCGVTFGMTVEEMALLPNGDEQLSLNPMNNCETWRDVLSEIATAICGFAIINRDGELEFRTWKSTADIQIDKYNRFAGGSWSDFNNKYTSLSVDNIEDGTTEKYSLQVDDGLTMNIGANPFLQSNVEGFRTRIRTAVLNGLQNLNYVPFKSTSLIDPCMDVGDVIEYVGGLADSSSKCCIMKLDFSYSKGVTLQGYGKNPAMADAKSKAEKSGGGGSKKDADSIVYYPLINVERKVITTQETSLFKIKFVALTSTMVEMWHELKLFNEFTAATQTVTLKYYFDDELDSYMPMDTYSENEKYHILKGDFWEKDVEAGVAHTWEVRALTDDGTAIVNIGDLRAMLKGQKLEASDAGGLLPEIEEEYIPRSIVIPAIELQDTIPTIIINGGGNYLELHNNTNLELHDGTDLELHDDGGNE